jgi:asparagine synthase (glutamine-hydrolysing)
MCGIAGIIGQRVKSDTNWNPRLGRMAQAMLHRGPDDGGVWTSADGRVGFASRRLAIRDLSPAGHMPMLNAEESLCIAYNGEIYNVPELRPQLEQLGYQFRSQTDTEVILHGYAAWGVEVVQRLRGMFAFAIYDARGGKGREQVFLARDRLGIKPLYYARTPEALVFASELKGLQAAGLTSREINPAGMIGYLSLGSVPNPLTIYQDIMALEPAHHFTVDLGSSGLTVTPQRYWSMPTDIEPVADYEQAVEQVRKSLYEAVRIRLVSDVPLGAFLSGGLDSSGLVALMRAATSGPIRTCSMVFEEQEYSEASYARTMAEAVGAEHFERVITVNDLTGEMEPILHAMDQPTLDGVNTYFVSQTARQAGLTVALSGLGGDELFGGYSNTFEGVPQMLRMLQRAQRVPGGASLAKWTLQSLPSRQRGARVIQALSQPATAASAYLTRRGLFTQQEIRNLLSTEYWQEGQKSFNGVQHVTERANLNGYAGDDMFAWVSRAELSTYTHHQLLRDTDVMSMAHSLEVRVPLLDHRLVEQVLRLPADIKRTGRGPKPLLHAALGTLLPPSIRERRDKQGFTLPFDRWMPELHTLASSSGDEGIFNQQTVQNLWQSHATGKMHWSRVWAVAAAQAWLNIS